MHSRPVIASPSFDASRRQLLATAQGWIGRCRERYADAPPTTVHDQGTYTISWLPALQAEPDAGTLDFLRDARDRMHAAYHSDGLWRHGYWAMQEVHHGTEHFELFLATLWRLDPGDDATIAPFIDMAEHLGNWSPDVAPWFDWDSGLYRSMFFGSSGIQEKPGAEINIADFFRCSNLALIAHGMTGEDRYLDLARRHSGLWADAVNAEPALPVCLIAEGPLYRLSEAQDSAYRSFAGMAPTLGLAVNRAENLLGSDAVNNFLTLWRHTGEARFREAARRVVEPLATQLHDPDAGAAAAAIRDYRSATGDTCFDAAVLAAVDALDPAAVREMALESHPPNKPRHDGIGKRADQPNWFEDGAPRRHAPITLALAAELRRDEALATVACDLARTQLELALDAYPDGRDHGCSARSVSAIARGHGRENNAGVLTAVLGPMLAWPPPAAAPAPTPAA